MKPLQTLYAAVLAAPVIAVTMVPVLAYAQTEQAASLLDALSLLSGGVLAAPEQAPQVTQDGDRFHVRIPLPKLTTPPDAAIDVTATPLGSGTWNITRLTFPSTGTIVAPGAVALRAVAPGAVAPGAGAPAAPNAPPVSLRFSIGQQLAHARIDPTLSSPSPYAMAWTDLGLHIDGAAMPGNLTIAQMTLDGTITGDPDGRMSTRSQTRADNWRFIGSGKTGDDFALSLRSATFRSDFNGLDRAQAGRLREAIRAVAATQKAPPLPGQPSLIASPALREQLHAMIEASAGLLSGFDLDETLQGLHFEMAAGNKADIGELRLAMKADSAADRLAGDYEISMSDITTTSVPAQYAPRRVKINMAFAGIGIGPLRHLLQEATEANADPVALRARAISLLNQPGARAGIDTILIESGPMLIQGNVRVRPTPDGSAVFDIHLIAHGLDRMLALVQSDPKAQQIMPMLFIAKGMGKPEGDGLAWDIAFANGAVTVNGVSMGQKPPGIAGARPPASR